MMRKYFSYSNPKLMTLIDIAVVLEALLFQPYREVPGTAVCKRHKHDV